VYDSKSSRVLCVPTAQTLICLNYTALLLDFGLESQRDLGMRDCRRYILSAKRDLIRGLSDKQSQSPNPEVDQVSYESHITLQRGVN